MKARPLNTRMEMRRWITIVEARTAHIDIGSRRITVWKNPTRTQLIRLLERMPVLRGLADAKTVMIWNADDAVHTQIAEQLPPENPWTVMDDYMDFYVTTKPHDEFAEQMPGLDDRELGAYSIFLNRVRRWNPENRVLEALLDD